MTKKSDVFWVTQRRSVPTAFKLFTGMIYMLISNVVFVMTSDIFAVLCSSSNCGNKMKVPLFHEIIFVIKELCFTFLG